MSELIDYIFEKLMNRVNTWGLWRMMHDKNSYQYQKIKNESKERHKKVNNLS